MLDINGYPLQASLNSLEYYYISKGTLQGFLDLLKGTWNYSDSGGYKLQDNKLYLHTGGWSGNEEVITYLKRNFIFWSMCWRSQHTGGHYEFDLSAFRDSI